METFGKTAWLILLAGSVALPFAGCTKSPTERFETYNELKKSETDQPATGAAAKKDDAGPQLTSTPVPTENKVVTTSAAPTGSPKSAPAPSTSASAAPARNGTNGTSGVYQASVASSGPSPGVVPAAATGAVRKVQLLVADRTFKTEGPEGAWRVTYDDIDLLKVLNMDPVPANADTMMPAWLKGLEGKRIRIRGFMYPPFQQTGIHAFALARDNQICCFGRNPKIYDLFDVLLRDGVTTSFLPNRPFDVVGLFHIRPEVEQGKLYRLYEIDDATVIVK
jgi:hypothetical protein